MHVSNAESLTKLARLWETGQYRQVSILIKTKKTFHTALATFEPELYPVIFVLISSTKILCRPDVVKQLAKFSVIFSFDLSANQIASRYVPDLTKVDYPQLDGILADIVRIIPPQSVRLIVCEEPPIRTVARLRDKFLIPGLGQANLTRFVDKSQLKAVAEGGGIAVAPGFVVTGLSKIENILARADEIGYPLFAKPVHACGSVDTQKVTTGEHLRNIYNKAAAMETSFIVEKYVEGTEYAAYCLLLNRKIHFTKIFRNAAHIAEFVHNHRALGKVELDRTCSKFQKILQLIRQAIEVFHPPDGVFAVELFDSDRGLIFSEMAIRLPGGSFTAIMERVYGVSIEQFHLEAQSDILPTAQFSEQDTKYVAYFRYPAQHGVVKQLIALPDWLQSTALAFWHVQVGQVMDDPDELSGKHETLTLILYNDSYASLKADFWNIYQKYTPVLFSTVQLITPKVMRECTNEEDDCNLAAKRDKTERTPCCASKDALRAQGHCLWQER